VTIAGLRLSVGIRRLVPALATVLLGAASLAPAATGAAAFGTQDDIGGVTVPQARIDQTLDLAARAGAKIFRVEANWSTLEPEAQGERNGAALAALDRLVAAASRRGMRTLLFIDRTPCWASAAPAEVRGSCQGPQANRPEVTRFRPADPGTVVPISTFLAARYERTLAAFQVWNEPDQANEKYWAGPNKVASYVAMTKALYRPLKQAAPSVPVLVGSFVGTDGRWLKAMYASGAKGSYDGLAVQFYTVPLYGLRNTRAVQLAHGDRKPIWLTEFGYTSCSKPGAATTQLDQRCVTRAGQARGMSDVISAVQRRSWVAAAIQYDALDDGPGGYTFGFADVLGRMKPAYAAIRRVLSGRVRAPKAPTARLRIAGRHVEARGTASLADLVKVTVTVRGVVRYRAVLRTDQRGTWRLSLPRQLGTRALVFRVSAGWTGRVTRRV